MSLHVWRRCSPDTTGILLAPVLGLQGVLGALTTMQACTLLRGRSVPAFFHVLMPWPSDRRRSGDYEGLITRYMTEARSTCIWESTWMILYGGPFKLVVRLISLPSSISMARTFVTRGPRFIVRCFPMLRRRYTSSLPRHDKKIGASTMYLKIPYIFGDFSIVGGLCNIYIRQVLRLPDGAMPRKGEESKEREHSHEFIDSTPG